ncbi:MAG: DUF481 domain-containing protein, partial [Deltaproteobacteria bacterium]|nr:DUF481 domain-containing protein [Deltaproteobacteria bacterium]
MWFLKAFVRFLVAGVLCQFAIDASALAAPTETTQSDDELEFDGDELGLLSIDFADVAAVHSPRVETSVFDDWVSATGKAIIIDDKVIIETAEGMRVFSRDELQSIIAGGERESDWWWLKLRFALSLNKGNTHQLTYDSNFDLRREDHLTLLRLLYNARFGRTDGVQNVRRQLASLDLQVFLSKRWFLVPVWCQFFNDRFQNIRFRATPATGAGVHIIDEPNVACDFEAGIGYHFLRYEDDSSVNGANPQSDVFVP